jgi:hypothetical protein
MTPPSPFFTYQDAVSHALDFLGGTPDALALRDSKRSVLAAYRELVNVRVWSYLINHDRVLTQGPFVTGYVAYNNATRQLLFYQAGQFPSWVGPLCKIRIGVVTSDIQQVIDNATLECTEAINFGMNIDYAPALITGVIPNTPILIVSPNHGLADGDTVIIENVLVAGTGLPMAVVNGIWPITVLDVNTFSLNSSSGAGLTLTPWDGLSGTWRSPPTTAYTLFADTYLLPYDFIKSDTAIFEGNFGGLTYSDATDQLWFERFQYASGTPRFYGLLGSKLVLGRLVIRFWPYPSIQKTIDFMYERRSRTLKTECYSTGTVTLIAGSLSVTGTGTTFDSSMAGSVLRVGTSTIAPTSWIGESPPTQELVVNEVQSPTKLTVLTAPTVSAPAVLYTISDPVDIELGSMLTAMLRGIEKQLAIARHLQDSTAIMAEYTVALKEAMAADSRSYQGRTMGGQRPRWIAPKYMPANFFPNTQ